jgi:hypothetical protein
MWLFIALAAVIVLGVAWVAIARTTLRMAARPATSVYDLYDAVDFVAERLPESLAAKLSSDDVEQILRWRLNHLRRLGLATLGRVDEDAEMAAAVARRRNRDIIAGDDDVIDAVLADALDADSDIDEVDVVVVLDLEHGYLQSIGAVGPQAGPSDR